MIDTHSHLLPGLDDGAADMAEALHLARAAAEAGVHEIICTPHVRDWGDPALAIGPPVLVETQAAIDLAGIPVRLHLGYELTFSFAASLEVEDLPAMTMSEGTRALLIEMPHGGWPMRAEDAVFRWRLQGYLPVLAHPERNDRVQREPEKLEALLKMGAVAQGTLPSVLGTFGVAARKAFLRLVADGNMALVASDAHFSSRRPPSLTEGLEALVKWAPEADVALLAHENPQRLLRGAPLREPEPIRVRRAWEKYLLRPNKDARPPARVDQGRRQA
ncbi:MAG: hypothetical protein KKA32_01215 [Actinobacteria bacterium]|nr:hypothetical protein [Actinomycetota bacterium]